MTITRSTRRIIGLAYLSLLSLGYIALLVYSHRRGGLDLHPFSLGLSGLAVFLCIFYYTRIAGKQIDSDSISLMGAFALGCFTLHIWLNYLADKPPSNLDGGDLKLVVLVACLYLILLLSAVLGLSLDPSKNSAFPKPRSVWRLMPAAVGGCAAAHVFYWSTKAFVSLGDKVTLETISTVQRSVRYSVFLVTASFFIRLLFIAFSHSPAAESESAPAAPHSR